MGTWVLRRCNYRRLVPSALLVGFAAGSLSACVSVHAYRTGSFALALADPLMLLAITVAYGAWASTRSFGPGPVVLASGTMASAGLVTAMGVTAAAADSIVLPGASEAAFIAAVFLVLVAAAALIGGLTFASTRLLHAVVLQDGLRCGCCAYDRSGIPAHLPCPECATPVNQRERAAPRWGRASLAALMTASALPVPLLWSARGGPAAPRAAQVAASTPLTATAFGTNQRVMPGSALLPDQRGVLIPRSAECTFIPLEAGSEIGVAVLVLREPSQGTVAQLQLARLMLFGGGPSTFEAVGPLAYRNLTSDELTSLTNGTGSALIEAFRAEAAARALLPAAAPKVLDGHSREGRLNLAGAKEIGR